MKKGLLKKTLALALIGALAIGAVGCGAKKESYDKIKESGKLVVGMSADYAPYEYHALIDGKDQIVGFDVDIAKEIAKDLGVELELKEMEFGSLVTAVKAGKIDMTISGMSPKPERREAVDFSDIYYRAEQAFLIQGVNKDKYKSLKDLEGKKVGAQMGSIQADIAKGIAKAEVKELSDINTLLLELENGNIDALIVEVPVATLAAKANPKLFIPAEVVKDEEGGSAIGMQKNSPKLVAEVNKTLKRLMDSGKINEFVKKAVEQSQYKK